MRYLAPRRGNTNLACRTVQCTGSARSTCWKGSRLLRHLTRSHRHSMCCPASRAHPPAEHTASHNLSQRSTCKLMRILKETLHDALLGRCTGRRSFCCSGMHPAVCQSISVVQAHLGLSRYKLQAPSSAGPQLPHLKGPLGSGTAKAVEGRLRKHSPDLSLHQNYQFDAAK